MKELNINNLGLKNGHLVLYEPITNPTTLKQKIRQGFGVLMQKKLSHWWGKTYFYYDTANHKLYRETLTWVGVLFHKCCGYRKELNSSTLWELFKEKKLVPQDSACPSKNKLQSVINKTFCTLAQSNDRTRGIFSDWYLYSNEENFQRVQAFVKKGGDVNAQDKLGATLLFLAVKQDNRSLVTYLINRGVEVNTRCETNSVFRRPLDFSLYNGDLEMVDTLLKAGANVNAKGYKGRTAIFYACGAECQTPTLNKDRPKNTIELMKTILDKNPELNLVDDYGLTPLDYAIKTNNPEIIALLEQFKQKENIDSRPENIERGGTQVAEISKEKKQILEDYGEGMVEALGGIDKFLKLPVMDFKKWNGTLDPTQFTAPVMRGKFADEPCLIFCYVPYDNYKIKGDFLRRRAEDNRWVAGGPAVRGELDFAMGSDGVPPGSEIEKQMFDRIRRLMSGQPVGRIKSYSDSVIKQNKDNIPIPKDAYLKGPDLEEFMKLDTDFYEIDPVDEAARLTFLREHSAYGK
jgi:hypothetical protein